MSILLGATGLSNLFCPGSIFWKADITFKYFLDFYLDFFDNYPLKIIIRGPISPSPARGEEASSPFEGRIEVGVLISPSKTAR